MLFSIRTLRGALQESSEFVVRPAVQSEKNVDFKLFVTVFLTVFVAELGDKTQLATLLYASDASHSKMIVFAASAAALVATSAIAVLAGSFVSNYLDPRMLNWLAGLGFVGVGLWILFAGD
jgi:putative Ca2+/H+ antiporter (TMEM165/GDT1 family)